MYTAHNHKGRLAVRCCQPHNETPRATVILWNTFIPWETAEWHGITEGAPLTAGGGNGSFGFYDPARSHHYGFDLPEGGQTKGDAETIDVPCPKVRKGTETRWHYGRWQKRTAKGWVSA